MAADFTIMETEAGLVMRSDKPRSWPRTWLGIVITAGAVYGLAHFYVSRPMLYIAMIVLAALSGVFEQSRREVTLTLSKFEAISVGSYGGGYKPARHVPLADIQRFGYREELSGGGEFTYRPSGLYAEIGHRSTCLLPFLNETQTAEAIDRIHKRFPHMLISSAGAGSILFNEESLTLNLSPATKDEHAR